MRIVAEGKPDMTEAAGAPEEPDAPAGAQGPPARAGSTNGAAPEANDAQVVYDAVLEVMRVAAEDPLLSERMALSQVRVAAHFADAPPLALTMLLDRNPIDDRGGRP